ncbi:hypothetical protein PVAP13_2NG336225 [Panicum virgatum]|uniref:Uncharacterized protein n=1 Tax=Panicum virgatum TaxID=38727 RepID=A0A8T0VFY8_PANVG|nr:hypothetical protein PVAP13_2NG336225 [Panicum virgatum]
MDLVHACSSFPVDSLPLLATVALGSSHSGEVMALSHLLLQPGRSVDIKLVGLDLLFKMA